MDLPESKDATASPDDRGKLSALLRLMPFARPYRGLLAVTFLAALLATLAQLAVPLLTAAVVDATQKGDYSGMSSEGRAKG